MNSKLYIECAERAYYAKTMRALENPLFPAVELLEKELALRGLIGMDDLIQWCLKVNGTGWDYRAAGEVVWVRPTRQPRRVAVYLRSFLMSLDGENYEPLTASSIIYQIATALQTWTPPPALPSVVIGHG